MKKTFTLMLGLGLVAAMSSCTPEAKIKGYAEEALNCEIKAKELKIEQLDLEIEIYEKMLELKDDVEFEKTFEKWKELAHFTNDIDDVANRWW